MTVASVLKPWRLVSVFLFGIIAGIIISMKFLTPPSTEYKIGKLKIKGDGNVLEDIISVRENNNRGSSPDPPPIEIEPDKTIKDYRKDTRTVKKYIRKQRRENRRENRRKARDGIN